MPLLPASLPPRRAPRPAALSWRAAAAVAATALLSGGLAMPGPAAAQQGQEWFVPGGQGGGQQRPPQGQPPRPAQPQAGRPAQGSAPPAPVVGIVDIPEIQRQAAAFGQVREEIGKRQQKLNEDLQREQTGWRDAQQELANQRAAMAPDQLRQRERDLQERITESQRIFRERARAIDQAAQQALVEIERAVAQVIQQVSSARNVNLVLRRELVIFNHPAFDLTEEVVAQVNRTLRSVTIPPEGSVGPAAAATPPAQPAQPAARPPAQGGGQRR